MGQVAIVKNIAIRAAEMTQWLRTLVAVSEDPSSAPSIHMVVYRHPSVGI